MFFGRLDDRGYLFSFVVGAFPALSFPFVACFPCRLATHLMNRGVGIFSLVFAFSDAWVSAGDATMHNFASIFQVIFCGVSVTLFGHVKSSLKYNLILNPIISDMRLKV